MSAYCTSSAPVAFRDLISKLNVKYIVVSYNNTYESKSGSSKNKITLEQIKSILEEPVLQRYMIAITDILMQVRLILQSTRNYYLSRK